MNAECKILWNNIFFSFFVVNGTVRLKLIQLIQDGPYNSITHNDDLKNIFPKENFTM